MFKPSNKVHFHYLVPPFMFNNRTQLKHFIGSLFLNENTPLQELSYVFCSDKYLFSYNTKYLNHNTFTDIITFSLAEPKTPVIGDIYISIDRVKENAFSLSIPFYKELHRVIFHGALHLCGYKDKSKSHIQVMRKKEDYYLSQYFVSRETV